MISAMEGGSAGRFSSCDPGHGAGAVRPTDAGATYPSDPAELISERACQVDFAVVDRQVRATGGCVRPLRMSGVQFGPEGLLYSTKDEPGETCLKACGSRLESKCPPCSRVYRDDAYQLAVSGMRGGKGVPDSVAAHPFLWVTLTAPSFGLVHGRRDGQRCHPRRDAETCEHGVRLSCSKVHEDGDECLGQPICPECYDYWHAVGWNRLAGELWRRTSERLKRTLALVLGVTEKHCKQLLRVEYVKVSEYQARGLVHFHAIVRLDRAMPAYRADEIHPPAARFDTRLLAHALREALDWVSAPVPSQLVPALGVEPVRWGSERDIQVLTNPAVRAGYVSKYATKSNELCGAVPHSVDADAVHLVDCSEHARAYMQACHWLQQSAEGDPRIGRVAHRFGYRGHALTKSRRFSTTFGRLRQARHDWRLEQLKRGDDEQQRRLAECSERFSRFEYQGAGHRHAAEAWWAGNVARQNAENRRAAREARE